MLELKYFLLKFIIPLKLERFFSIEKVRHLKFNTGKLHPCYDVTVCHYFSIHVYVGGFSYHHIKDAEILLLGF